MRVRNIGFLLGILNVLLLATCATLYIRDDRTAPELNLEEVAYSYEEGISEQVLLEGVSAWDAQEGDITDRIVIEKIVADKAHNKAIITYGVADSKGNVCKASRELVMSQVLVRPKFPTAGEAKNGKN